MLPGAVLAEPIALEADARARWSSLESAVSAGEDRDGRRLEIPPGELLAPVLRRSRLIGAPASLYEAVVAYLAEAVVDRVRAAPDVLAVDGRGPVQLMALRVRERLVPLRPDRATVQIWPVVNGAELVGQPVVEVRVESDVTGWVPAVRIAEDLLQHLS